MSWRRLSYEDMRLYLAKDELDRLESVSIDADLSSVVNDTLDLVSDTFRGTWIGKGYNIDVRPHYTCSTYWPFILAYARWTLWNRFPSAQAYALTETRKDEWKLAADLLKNPYIGLETPDYSDDPELSGNTGYQLSADPAITIPWLREVPQYGKFGFPETYWPSHGFQPAKYLN